MATEYFLLRERLQDLLELLQQQGYACVGPQVKHGAIIYDSLDDTSKLPVSVVDQQEPGSYRLSEIASHRYFSWANGPQAIKPQVFRPRTVLWSVNKSDDGALEFKQHVDPVKPVAMIGVRACDLAALKLMDQHFLEGEYQDPSYHQYRNSLFLVSVNCTHPASTCFCASTGDGPAATNGFDIGMDELDDGFVVVSGSARGQKLLDELGLELADPALKDDVIRQRQAAIEVQQRSIPGQGLKDRLLQNLEHEHWDEVARRCLSCGNCTSVCPTCFCYQEGEVPSLDTETFEHYREWDSCFTQGHSYIHGLTIRNETRHRYRQWLVHKLAGWHDQFGRSGCVGCGRCITWCPVGIDITEEAAVFSKGVGV